MKSPTVAVVGGGPMGLASALALARRGARPIVLERFHHVNDRGSHGGFTRILRFAYHEGSSYVPWVREAADCWADLGRRVDDTLFVQCGLLEFGPPDDLSFLEARAALRAHEMPHEIFDASQARARWPIELPDAWIACLDSQAGYLRVAVCMNALAAEADRAGVQRRYGSHVVDVESRDGWRVSLADGTHLDVDLLVVSAGIYLPGLLPEVAGPTSPCPVRPVRRVLAWTEPNPASIPALARMPVWAGFTERGFFYGFPWNSEGVEGFKLACHYGEALGSEVADVNAETLDREVVERDLEPLLDFIDRHIPTARGPVCSSMVCPYASTPDEHFVVDRIPGREGAVVVGGFSGHGFKFAPAIGELAARLLLDESSAPPVEFSAARRRSAPSRT